MLSKTYRDNPTPSARSIRINMLMCALMLIAMTVIFTLMMLWTPIRLDDYTFIRLYRSCNGDDTFSLQSLIDMMMRCREYENARLSNFCSPLSTIIQPWATIFPYVAGFICTLMIVIALRLTDIRINLAAGLAIIWISCVVLLPWRDQLFTRDFALNYPFAAVLNLGFVYLMCVDNGNRLKQPIWFVAIFVLGLIAAAWHEGFAMPVGTGMGVWALSRRLHMSWQWWTIMICFGIAAFAVFLCPGMFMRTQDELAIVNISEMIKIVIQLMPCTLTIIAVILATCIRRTRTIIADRFKHPTTKVIFTAMVASFALALMIRYTHRMSFFPNLCTIIFWGQLLAKRIERLKPHTSIIIAVVCTLLCTAQGSAACVWQYRIKRQHDIVLPMMLNSPTGTAFYDVYYPDDIPHYTLLFPSRTIWYDHWAFSALDLVYGNNNKHHIVVPTELAHPRGRAISADGFIHSTGMNLWSHNVSEMPGLGMIDVNILLKDGRRVRKAVQYYRFISADADTFFLYRPHHARVSEIDSIEFVELPTGPKSHGHNNQN